jgi:hypothetical protein
MFLATLLAWLLIVYLGIGVVAAPFLAFRVLGRIDPSAAAATRGFRIFMIPGLIVLWPVPWSRVLRGLSAPPREGTGHKKAWIPDDSIQ